MSKRQTGQKVREMAEVTIFADKIGRDVSRAIKTI